MTLETISKYPRLVASMVAAMFAAQVTGVICASMHNVVHPTINIISAMFSAALWAAIICKRITNISQSCTYFRAAVLGGVASLCTILIVGVVAGVTIRSVNMLTGLASVQQTLRYIFKDDIDTNLGGGVFILIFFGWFLVPIGALGGVIMRWVRSLYEIDEKNELYEGNDTAKLHTGDE